MQDDDAALLRRYAAGSPGADAAFTALVHRHLTLVYSAALRQVGGDAHLAQDVTQTVFSDLARKATTVARHPVLAGWLYTSTHYAASRAVRTEQRRRKREQAAHAMMEDPRNDDSPAEIAWDYVRPTLDAALQQLAARDRDALLLRFFENQPFSAIGARLALSENAARMRVDRALDKLRAQLARRGVRSTAAALGAALASHSVTAAPAGVAATVASTALAGTAATGLASALTVMTAQKLSLALAGAVLLGGGSVVLTQRHAQAALHDEIARLRTGHTELAALRAENETLARAAQQTEAWRRAADELPRLRAEVAALRANATRPPSPSAASSMDTSTAGGSAPKEPAYDIRQLDQPPKPTTRKPPTFPDEYRRLGLPGSAKIALVVGPDGRVRDAEVTDASDEQFAASAIEAVKQWTFEPGRKNGTPVATRLTVPIVFTIRSDHTDWF